MKQVFVARDITEAHFVREMLESNGLEVAVNGEDLWGTRGELPALNAAITIWVLDDAREADARRVVEEYESSLGPRDVSLTAWRCPKCSQEIEAPFTACWACGTERSAGGPEAAG
jgi:hypothetical protein